MSDASTSLVPFLARLDMGLALGFHIIFASIGMTMPLLMVLAEWRWLKTGQEEYLTLTKAWAKGTAVFFAIGAVSGTVLAFELGLLFPKFMEIAGGVIGLPFALEGFAFFTEAVFLGIYLYAWDRISPKLHLFAGIVVALSGCLSGVFVTTANAWMNHPVGARFVDGKFVDIEPWKAMLSPFNLHEIPHSILATYVATSVAVAAIHAFVLLRNPESFFHKAALKLCLMISIPLSLVQPLIGHFSGEQVAHYQPLKLAAMEGLFETQRHADLHIGGWVDYEEQKVKGAIALPGMLSFLATRRFDGEVKGLNDFPKEDWPSSIVRYCFQVMVGCGSVLFALSLWSLWRLRKEKDPFSSKRFLKALVWCGPLGIIATETGWIVTEVGRQPWTIYGILRTAEAVTMRASVTVSVILFPVLYLILGITVLTILKEYVTRSPGWKGKAS